VNREEGSSVIDNDSEPTESTEPLAPQIKDSGSEQFAQRCRLLKVELQFALSERAVLKDSGGSHAVPNARRLKRIAFARALELVHDLRRQNAAGGAERVPVGDDAAIWIHFRRIHAKSLDPRKHNTSKCLIHFKEVNVLKRKPSLREDKPSRRYYPVQHERRVASRDRACHDASTLAQSEMIRLSTGA